jgi:fructokinase
VDILKGGLVIIVIGEILIDMFPDYRRIGGAPFNFAFHLKKLGFPVRFISRIGDDGNGRRIMDMLEAHGFDAADIQVDEQRSTGTVRVTLDENGVPQFDIRRQVAYDYLNLDPSVLPDTGDAGMIYFGTLLQRTDDACRRVKDFLTRLGSDILRFCDINMRPPHVNRRAVVHSLRQADLLKLNEDELADIRQAFGGPVDAQMLIPWLMDEFSIGAVALTLGSEGGTFVSRGTTVSFPAEGGSAVIDTVGAGDGFAAILAAGHIRRIPWEETCRQASRFAGRICGIPGAVPDDDGFYADFRPFMDEGS